MYPLNSSHDKCLAISDQPYPTGHSRDGQLLGANFLMPPLPYLFIALLAAMVTIAAAPVRGANHTFWAGSDVSYFGYIESHGGVYRYNHQPIGLIQAFKRAGCNCLRMRLWHRATAAEKGRFGKLGTTNDLAYTLPLAKRIKKAGFHFVLDMHFSPSWADPAHQPIPAAWRHLPLDQLCGHLRAYCRRVMTTLRKAHALPDMVLAGNEINDGILWPTGKLWVHHRGRWNRVAKLLNAAIDGIDAGSGPHKPKIMIQVGDFSYAPNFYKNLISHGVKFDFIGYDFYPFWGGPLKHLKSSLIQLCALGKPIIVAETAYPFINDADNANWLKKKGMRFPFSPAGQAAYAQALVTIVKALPHHLGRGVWWWGGEYNADQPAFAHNPWSYRSLFDIHGNALPAMRVLGTAAK